jgi:hypothetical protein
LATLARQCLLLALAQLVKTKSLELRPLGRVTLLEETTRFDQLSSHKLQFDPIRLDQLSPYKLQFDPTRLDQLNPYKLQFDPTRFDQLSPHKL